MSAVKAAMASPILAMHARYEAAWVEFNAIDRARTALNTNIPDNCNLEFRYAGAMKASNGGIDALRLAIFYQVPTSWQEAMILQFHLYSIFDAGQVVPEEEQLALNTAIETLFDFMCCKVDADHERLGHQFQTGANLVFEKRRYRTGNLED